MKQVFTYYVYYNYASIPVKGLLGNRFRLDCQIAVSNWSYDQLRTDLCRIPSNWIIVNQQHKM